MPNAQLALVGLAGIIAILFGIRYLAAKAFMPYHAIVAGRSWSEIEPGVQAVILGMLKIIGGNFIGFGLTLFWLLLPLAAGQPWTPWAVLSAGAATLLPILYVTVTLRRIAPAAPTPVLPTVVVLALLVAGAGLALIRQ